MRERARLAGILAQAAGGSSVMEVLDPGDGWPSRCLIRTDEGPVEHLVFIGRIGRSHRGRDAVERRFQNPGQDHPIVIPPGARALLLGLWFGDGGRAEPGRLKSVAGFDPRQREGHPTRFSMFVPLAQLEAAAAAGWAEHRSGSGEMIRVFRPELLPVYAGLANVDVEAPQLAPVVQASLEEPELPPAERARRAGMRLVRDARFRQRVLDAYGGRCALCGLDDNLIDGAHIYPASEPHSPDEVWNGLALCPTHHRMFDRHLIAIHPDGYGIRYHPTLLERAEKEPALQPLVSAQAIRLPPKPGDRPKPDMLRQRYRLYEEAYGWATPLI